MRMRQVVLLFSCLVLVFIMFLSSQTVEAQENMATVHGEIYDWYTLDLLPNVIVEVNSTPVQKIVATDGTYSFNLPNGSYVIRAIYYEERLLYGEENITIVGPGEFALDIIMFPPLDENIFDNEIFTDWDFPYEAGADYTWVYISIASILAIIALVFLVRGKFAKKKVVSPPPKLKTVELPRDLKEVLDVIIQNEGRITQTELRTKLPYSEAKVSLLIADLEDRGLIRKIKKGRGNIIVLTK